MSYKGNSYSKYYDFAFLSQKKSPIPLLLSKSLQQLLLSKHFSKVNNRNGNLPSIKYAGSQVAADGGCKRNVVHRMGGIKPGES